MSRWFPFARFPFRGDVLYKGGGKAKADPASYRGICLSPHVTKLFEGLLGHRLTQHTEQHDTLTPYQFGSRPGKQTHDAIYTLLAAIYSNDTYDASPTYCAFVDFSTAYPSTHRDRLGVLLHNYGIHGKLWKLLRESFNKARVRVLHPLIKEHEYRDILRGLPEGSRLSPTLFGVLVAELLHQLKNSFPLAQTKITNGYQWLGAIAYVDDLVLISKSPLELQQMINTCQTWCEKSRIEISASKTKIVVFKPKHIPPSSRQQTNQHQWHLQHSFPTAHRVEIEQVSEFKYLGVLLDDDLSMRPLTNQILNSIQKSHLKLQATLAELRQNNHDQSSYPGHTKISPQVVRRLWQSCVQIQATQYLRYIAHPPLIEEIQTKLNSTLQKAFKCYGQPTNLQADLGVPPLYTLDTRTSSAFTFASQSVTLTPWPHPSTSIASRKPPSLYRRPLTLSNTKSYNQSV